MSGSIRRRLILLVLGSLCIVWGIALVSSYRQATREIGAWENARLAELAQILILLDQRDLRMLANARIDVREEEKGGETSANDEDDDDALPRDALFQVRDADNHVLAGSPQLDALHAWDLPLTNGHGARTIFLEGKAWHTFTLRDDELGYTIRVLEPANTRSDLVTGVARRIARPLVYALPALALLVWFSVGLSLAPLKTLSEAIRGRDINKLEPIDIGRAPVEVRPLVDAVSHVLARLRYSMERQRAFTADAAHELKTPLAAIKVQAQVALGEADPALRRLAMERVVQGVDRSARLAEQLLLLARLDEHEKIATSPLKAAAIAKDAMLANEQSARQKNMRMALTGDPHAEIAAEPVLIGILLDNLIDNAIKYGRVGGRVEIAVRPLAGRVLLTVSDDGLGVAPDDLAHLTNRFFRAAGSQATGSGLGLSIVARIVDHFDAQLHFGAGLGPAGLAVEISFPACAAAA